MQYLSNNLRKSKLWWSNLDWKKTPISNIIKSKSQNNNQKNWTFDKYQFKKK